MKIVIYVYCLVFMLAATLSLKLKPPVVNIPGFHILLVLAPTFIFTVHCRELELGAGTVFPQLEQRVLYFPSGWSAQHSCLFFVFDTGAASVHL